MNNVVYEFDVWYIKETDYGLKLGFLRTIDVAEDMDIQDIRKQIQSEIYPITSIKIDLQVYKTKAIRKDTHAQIVMRPEAPYVLLSSNKSYTVKTVVETVKTSYDDNDKLNNFFTLEPLPRMKIIACLYYNE